MRPSRKASKLVNCKVPSYRSRSCGLNADLAQSRRGAHGFVPQPPVHSLKADTAQIYSPQVTEKPNQRHHISINKNALENGGCVGRGKTAFRNWSREAWWWPGHSNELLPWHGSMARPGQRVRAPGRLRRCNTQDVRVTPISESKAEGCERRHFTFPGAKF